MSTMAVVSMMTFPGDTDELQAKMQGMTQIGRDLARKHGGLGTIVARSDEGLLVINLWENEEGRHAMAEEPAVQQGLRDAGLPAPAFKGYEVLEMHILPEAVTES
jgi:hypothetical protein